MILSVEVNGDDVRIDKAPAEETEVMTEFKEESKKRDK